MRSSQVGRKSLASCTASGGPAGLPTMAGTSEAARLERPSSSAVLSKYTGEARKGEIRQAGDRLHFAAPITTRAADPRLGGAYSSGPGDARSRCASRSVGAPRRADARAVDRLEGLFHGASGLLAPLRLDHGRELGLLGLGSGNMLLSDLDARCLERSPDLFVGCSRYVDAPSRHDLNPIPGELRLGGREDQVLQAAVAGLRG
jgi:hypothetical protein